MSLLMNPLSAVLQNLCGRYLILESDAETLALELRRRQVTLRNVLFNTASFNEELVRFGLELRTGHVTQAELRVIDFTTCSTELELETLTLHLSPASTQPVVRGRQESKCTGGMISSLIPIEALWQGAAPLAKTVWSWFKSNLKVTVHQLVIHLEAKGEAVMQLELLDVEHTSVNSAEDGGEIRPQLKAGEVRVAFPDASSSASFHRVLTFKRVALMLDLLEEMRIGMSVTVAAMEMDLVPQALLPILDLLAPFKAEEDVFMDTTDDAFSVYYDATSDAGVSVYSDVTESAFFDCEEGDFDQEASPSMTLSFNFSVHQANASVRAGATEDAVHKIQLLAEDVHCRCICGEDCEMEISFGQLQLLDQSPSASPIRISHSITEIPASTRSMMASHDGRSSYLQLGFSQLPQKSCLSIRLKKGGERFHVDVQSSPVVFWSSCDSIQRVCSVLNSFCRPSFSSSISNESRTPRVELDWSVAGVYGVIEQPSTDSHDPQGLFSLELKTTAGTPLVSCRKARDNCQLHSLTPAEMHVTSISVAELTIYHCPCSEATVTSCHCILSCTAQNAPRWTLLGAAASTDTAMTFEIRKAFRSNHHSSDLCNLAYRLVHSYSQSDAGSFQERKLSCVEFEGKAVHSADVVCELLLESVKVDVRVEDVEACMDTVLSFWQPSKMADQLKTHQSTQTVVILNLQQLAAKVEEEDGLHPLEVMVEEMETCLVSGLQRKTISTLAVSVSQVAALGVDGSDLCRIGKGMGDGEPGFQFFQVSELDFRNAKFKQWAALRQNETCISVDQSLLRLKWIAEWIRTWIVENKERIQTDIEVENTISFIGQDTQIQYKTADSEGDEAHQRSLVCHMKKGNFTLQNLQKMTAELRNAEVLVGLHGGTSQKVAHEEYIQFHLRPLGEERDVEIRNQQCTLELDPQSLADVVHVLRSVCSLHEAEESDEMEVDLEAAISPNVLQGIEEAVFCTREETQATRKKSLHVESVEHEDEDGFVLVDDFSFDKEVDAMKRSQATWLESGPVRLQEDYIQLPNQSGLLDDSMHHSESSSDVAPAAWSIRGVDLSLICSFMGSRPAEYVQVSVKGMNLTHTSFRPGSHYQSRWSASLQECEVMDHRVPEEGLCVLQRNRSQLRTEFSRRLKHPRTLSFPMLQLTLESVFPEAGEDSKTTEMRVDLAIVPLRLRLSHSLLDFAKTYLHHLPSLQGHSTEGVYFQKCTVAAFFVVIDYCPRTLDLERLRRGRASELMNMVQWEGLEFFLHEMKVCGISGWDALLTYIIQNWTRDITHSQRHRLLGGLPALGILKRVSPAAHDVVHAAVSKVTRSGPAEQDIRGVRMAPSLSLSRALGEFGRVFSLEVLNLCANGTEGIHLVVDGTDAPPAPSNAPSSLKQASSRLKRAAHSVITEPIESVRSGEGIGVAMTKALWAAPKALLAPASAAVTVLHGTLRSACEALDTERVLDS